MMETGFGPGLTLATYMKEMDADRAVKTARELCSQLGSDPESFHGDIWPGNVRLDGEDKAVLGNGSTDPVSQRRPDQVEYAAPEFFWDGVQSASADVYSVGLLLYAGCNGGYLPFQPTGGDLTDKDRSGALRRRMKGEKIEAPAGVSHALGSVIEKALAYEPEDRYITARELLGALNETDEALPAGEAAVVAEAAAIAEAAMVGEALETEDLPEETPAEIAEAKADVSETELSPASPEDETIEEEVPEETPAEEAPQEEVPVPAEEESAPVPETIPIAAAEELAPETPKYTVQKDFEKTRAQRDSSVTPASHRRRRRSPLLPVLGVVVALAVLGGVGAMVFGGGDGQNISSPFTPNTDDEVVPSPSPTPVVITPAPNDMLDDEKDTDGDHEDDVDDETAPSPSPAPEDGEEKADGGDHDTAGDTGAGNGTATGGDSDTGAGNGGATTSTGSGTSAGGGMGTAAGTGTGSGSGGSTPATPSLPSYTVTPAEGTVYISGIGVNVRSGPGTEYPIIGSASTGYELKRTGTVNGWSRVEFKGTVGFVSNTYLTETAPATETPAPTEAPETPPPAEYAVETGDMTYAQAKEAAEADGKALAVIADEDEFDAIVEKLEGTDLEYVWLGVEYDSGEGVWKWSDGTVLELDDEHWADGNPYGSDDILLLALLDGEWQYISIASETFDPDSGTYAGKLGYVTD